MGRITRIICLAMVSALVVLATAENDGKGSSRDLLQRNQAAQQQTTANIKRTVQQGASPQKTQQTARAGVKTAQVVAGRSGLPTQTALKVTQTPRPAGRQLLQNNRRDAATRSQIAAQQTTANIKRTVQQGASPQKTQQTARAGVKTAQVVAGRSGLPPQTAVKVAQPIRTAGRHLLQNNRRDAATRSQIAAQQTTANIKRTVQQGASPQKTQQTARAGVKTAQVVAGRSGLPPQTAVKVAQPIRTAGRHLLQNRNQGAAGARSQIAQQVASQKIKQTVQQGAKPQQTKQAAKSSLAATRLVAQPNGLRPQVGTKLATNGK